MSDRTSLRLDLDSPPVEEEGKEEKTTTAQSPKRAFRVSLPGQSFIFGRGDITSIRAANIFFENALITNNFDGEIEVVEAPPEPPAPEPDWLPSDLTSSVSWWDMMSSSITKSGADIIQIDDLVGSNNLEDLTHASPLDVASDSDLGGRRACQQGYGEGLEVAVTAEAQPFTLWWIGTYDTTDGGPVFGDTDYYRLIRVNLGFGYYTEIQVGATMNGEVTEPLIDTPYLIVAVINSDSGRLLINNVEQRLILNTDTTAMDNIGMGVDIYGGYGGLSWTSAGYTGVAMSTTDRDLLWQWAQDNCGCTPKTLIEYSESSNGAGSDELVSPEFSEVGFEVSFSPGTQVGVDTIYFIDSSNYLKLITTSLLRMRIDGTNYDIIPSSNFSNGNNYTIRVEYGANMVLSGDATGTIAIGSTNWDTGFAAIGVGRETAVIDTFAYGTLEMPVSLAT